MVRANGSRAVLLVAAALVAVVSTIQIVGLEKTEPKETLPIEVTQRFGAWLSFWNTPLAVPRSAASIQPARPPVADVDVVDVLETKSAPVSIAVVPLAGDLICPTATAGNLSGTTVLAALPNDPTLLARPVVLVNASEPSQVVEIERVGRCNDASVAQGRVRAHTLENSFGFIGARPSGMSWLTGSINANDAFSGLRVSHRVSFAASQDLGFKLWDQLELPQDSTLSLSLSTPLGRSVAYSIERFGGSVVEVRPSSSQLSFTFSNTQDGFRAGDPGCSSCPERSDLQKIAKALRARRAVLRQTSIVALGDRFVGPSATSATLEGMLQAGLAQQAITSQSVPSISLNRLVTATAQCRETLLLERCVQTDALSEAMKLLAKDSPDFVLFSPSDFVRTVLQGQPQSVAATFRIENFLSRLVTLVQSAFPNSTIVLLPESGSSWPAVGAAASVDIPSGSVVSRSISDTRFIANIAESLDRISRTGNGFSLVFAGLGPSGSSELSQVGIISDDDRLLFQALPLFGAVRSVLESPDISRKR
jgi:hypothetical protein